MSSSPSTTARSAFVSVHASRGDRDLLDPDMYLVAAGTMPPSPASPRSPCRAPRPRHRATHGDALHRAPPCHIKLCPRASVAAEPSADAERSAPRRSPARPRQPATAACRGMATGTLSSSSASYHPTFVTSPRASPPKPWPRTSLSRGPPRRHDLELCHRNQYLAASTSPSPWRRQHW